MWKETDAVFCDVVAAIGNPRIRASVIKERQGINNKSCPHINHSMQLNYPSIDNAEMQQKSNDNDNDDGIIKTENNIEVKQNANKSQNGGKKKQKKIVISSF